MSAFHIRGLLIYPYPRDLVLYQVTTGGVENRHRPFIPPHSEMYSLAYEETLQSILVSGFRQYYAHMYIIEGNWSMDEG